MSKANPDRVYDLAAEVFQVLAAPMRLKIIAALSSGDEKNVTELLALINTTQPNMSQHLNLLYRHGVVAKRREGVQIFYRVVSDHYVQLCNSMFQRIAHEIGGGSEASKLAPHERLIRTHAA
jgi:DNA-binding transcriptional ArsR family regulator